MNFLLTRLVNHVVKTAAISVTVLILLQTSSSAVAADPATTVFAGGCFWCTESDFEKFPGVIKAEPGYTDGQQENPTYKQVSAGRTGHTEAVLVTYDPDLVSYAKLVEYFWLTIDPTQADGQFCDHGSQYRSAIYYDSPQEKSIVEASLAELQISKPFSAEIATQIAQRSQFYQAEDYHQDYYKKNPMRYNYYRRGCGRDQRLKALWGELAHH